MSGASAASEEPRRRGSGRGPGEGRPRGESAGEPGRWRRRAQPPRKMADILLLYEPERETEGAAEMERREGREERGRRARDPEGGCGRARPFGAHRARWRPRGRTEPATPPRGAAGSRAGFPGALAPPPTLLPPLLPSFAASPPPLPPAPLPFLLRAWQSRPPAFKD